MAKKYIRVKVDMVVDAEAEDPDEGLDVFKDFNDRLKAMFPALVIHSMVASLPMTKSSECLGIECDECGSTDELRPCERGEREFGMLPEYAPLCKACRP